MTRQKVKLAYITNASARKATYKKRKKSLINKANELSTLCDIDACVIIYSPYEAQPEVYPSPLGAQQVLSKFKRMPEIEQSKKMENQESFLTQQIAKVKEQLYKQKKDNREKEITQIMFQSLTGEKSLQDVDLPDLKDIDWLIEKYLNDINQRMKKMGISQEQEDHKSQVMAVQATTVTERPLGMQRHPKWFIDLMINPQDQEGFDDQKEVMPSIKKENVNWPNGF